MDSERVNDICVHLVLYNIKITSAIQGKEKSDILEVCQEKAVIKEIQGIEAVIDSVFEMERASEAHQRVEGGHTRGKVIITVC